MLEGNGAGDMRVYVGGTEREIQPGRASGKPQRTEGKATRPPHSRGDHCRGRSVYKPHSCPEQIRALRTPAS